MPRNPLDQRAHTRAQNRARAELVHRHKAEFDELYEVEFAAAKIEVRETDGARFAPGPRIDGLPAILRICPSCQQHHEHEHTCPVCGCDLETGDGGPAGRHLP